jgi:hypothetical protein
VKTVSGLSIALPRLDSLPDSIDTFIRMVDMEILLIVFGTVSVDSIGPFLSDTLVLKGNCLLASYCFRNRTLEGSSFVSCILHESRAGNQYDKIVKTSVSARGQGPTAHRSVSPL